MEQNQAHWFLSESAFKALFYPLPAVFLNKDGTGMVRIDARCHSPNDSVASPELIKQSTLLNLDEHSLKRAMREAEQTYNYAEDAADSSDDAPLGGQRMGVLSHHRQQFGTVDCAQEENATFHNVGQALIFFVTTDGAAEYTYTVNADAPSTHPALAERAEQKARELGVQGLIDLQLYVSDTMKFVACSGAVHNVYFMLQMLSDTGMNSEEVFVSMAVKSIVHLYRQLVHYRSTDPSNLADASSVLPPDLDMCAYCGKESSTRMHCSQCKMVWYCSADCQITHWKIKGPFSHRRECKLLADPSVMPPAIPVGRIVMIHGLTSAAGQRLNGKDVIVVTQPTDNGRLGVLLVDDVSKEEAKRLKMGSVSWVPATLQKAIKIGNLELVWIARSAENSD